MNNQSHTAIAGADTWVAEPKLRAFLGMSSSTIKRLRRRGLPSVGTDRLRRFHIAEVLRWLAEHA
jgi:phage terminase Nu1 subunit (DNA packaging protein)